MCTPASIGMFAPAPPSIWVTKSNYHVTDMSSIIKKGFMPVYIQFLKTFNHFLIFKSTFFSIYLHLF